MKTGIVSGLDVNQCDENWYAVREAARRHDLQVMPSDNNVFEDRKFPEISNKVSLSSNYAVNTEMTYFGSNFVVC